MLLRAFWRALIPLFYAFVLLLFMCALMGGIGYAFASFGFTREEADKYLGLSLLVFAVCAGATALIGSVCEEYQRLKRENAKTSDPVDIKPNKLWTVLTGEEWDGRLFTVHWLGTGVMGGETIVLYGIEDSHDTAVVTYVRVVDGKRPLYWVADGFYVTQYLIDNDVKWSTLNTPPLWLR